MQLFLFSSMYDSVVYHNNTNNVAKYAVIQNIISIQWEENYQAPGTFYIEILDKNVSDLFVPGSTVLREDTRSYAIIEYVYRKNGNLIAKGYLDALDKIVNKVTQTITNTYSGLYNLLRQNGRDNLQYTRNTSTVSVAVDSYQTTWETLRDTIIELCKKTKTGYKTINGESVLIYKGNVLSHLSLSDATGDFYNDSLELDNSDAANVAIVAGEDSGTNRIVELVNNPDFEISTTEAYKEIYIDARDIQKTDGMTESAYRLLLRERGLQKLQDHNKVNTFKCELKPKAKNALIYRKDFIVGDVLPVWSKKYNRRTNMRVISATEVFEPKYKNFTRVITDLEEV